MKKQKKLKLNKSTIRILADDNLKEIAAGFTSGGQSYRQACDTTTVVTL